jgi:Fe-S-cluster containining protein
MNTDMPLIKSDIERLRSLGFIREEFTIEVKEEIRLRNVSGKCYFLKGKLCSVYKNRPEGCRIYPLVFEEDSNKYVLDSFCPYRKSFTISETHKAKLKALLNQLETEKRPKSAKS